MAVQARREVNVARGGAASSPVLPASNVEAAAGLAAALAELRDDLGFQTASLFIPAPHGWQLLLREGPVHTWHAVLDPVALENTPEAVEHRDVRAIPGIGPRLSALGCASVAILPLPDGGRVLLDSSIPSAENGWIERARPYLALISIMSGPIWPAGPSLRSHREVDALQRVFSACQNVLERPGATLEGLLYEVRNALHADELFLISEHGADMEVMSSPAENWPRRLPRAAQASLPRGAGASLDEDAVRALALSLGVSSKALVGAFGRPTGDIEILLAGWTDDLPLTPLSMSFVARAMSTARVALEGRRQAVTTLVDRERTRMAYALHDGLTQTVTSAVLELEALRQAIERDPAEAMAVIDSTKTEIRRALGELRAILFDLHGGDEEERKPEALTSEVEDVVKRWRLPARVSVEGDLNAVPAQILSVAYVVIREALANAAKHSSASNVSVALAVGKSDLVVTVGDGGRGFTTREEQHARGNQHMGLDMLRRRVHEVGGLLHIESQPGKGTRVRARLPMREVES